MSKGKGLFKKLLAVTAIAGGAAVLIAKFKKNGCKECAGDEDFEDDGSAEETEDSSRNYVPLSHGEEEESPEEDPAKEEPAAGTSQPEDPVSEEAATEEPASEEAAAKEPVSGDAAAKEAVSEEPSAAPSTEEIAAKLEQAVAETEARYEKAAKEAGVSGDK